MIGENVASFILEEDREKVRKAYASLTPENPVVTYEQRTVRPDGEMCWQEWTDHAIFDEKGNMVEVQEVGRDTTDRKRLEEQLRRADRFTGIGEAAAMVGHDLRNPLQVIVNKLYLANRAVKNLSSPYSETVAKLGLEELFQELQYQTSYMNKIVSDLQDYARPVTPQLTSVNVNKLLDETFSTIPVPANVKVSRQVENNFPELFVDRELMRRALTNLIRNAFQAMPNGGKLAVKASRIDEAVLISIQDTGAGISQENLKKIWTPFFTTKAKGTGLGLAVSKRLVDAHSGKITVETEVGKGSTITVILPLR